MARILHVTESHAGGVSRAIQARVEATPNHEHHLLWAGSELPDAKADWATTYQYVGGIVSRFRSLRNRVSELEPDLIHAHSSWAGFHARLRKLNVPVVYEPHCFKFDDPRLGFLKRNLFRLAERQLLSNTAAIGTLSHHEDILAKSLKADLKTVRISNVPSLPILALSPFGCPRDSVVTIGRICRQKDPAFFLDVVAELRRLNAKITPIWIGDGEQKYRESLIDSGVHITGWLDAEKIQAQLYRAIYLHTASYEGFPLSILDAAACGSPIVARRISPFKDIPVAQAETPRELANLILKAQVPGADQLKTLENNKALLSLFSKEELSRQLNHLYSIAAQPLRSQEKPRRLKSATTKQ